MTHKEEEGLRHPSRPTDNPSMNAIKPESTADGLRDHFLIAMPSQHDGYFSHTVTYICEHNDEGAMGLVINQPIDDLRLPQLLQQLDLDPVANTPEYPVYRGGPAQPEQGFVLHSPEAEWLGTRSVGPDLALTTSRDILEAMALGKGPQHALIALGYAGWGPGQLEEEIMDDAWLIAPASRLIVFTLAAGDRWNAAARLIGIDMNLISQVSGHA
jgi:putative transcriptional regulator